MKSGSGRACARESLLYCRTKLAAALRSRGRGGAGGCNPWDAVSPKQSAHGAHTIKAGSPIYATPATSSRTRRC